MAVAVLGPGAVGGSLAVQLSLAGEPVVCVARRETARAIAEAGLTLVRDGEEQHARPRAVEALDEPVDLLLVTVKAYDLEEALDRVVSDPRTVLPLLNGLDHMAVLGARFADVVAGTVGRFEAYREGPTRIVQHQAPLVTVAGEHVPAQLVTAGVEVRAGGSEQDVLWEKLARQGPLALLTSVTGLRAGDLRGDPRLRAAVREACAVAAADGAATSFAEQWAVVETWPDRLTSSTARDVAAGRPSELDAVAGAIVRAGRRLGVPTPTFDALLSPCPA